MTNNNKTLLAPLMTLGFYEGSEIHFGVAPTIFYTAFRRSKSDSYDSPLEAAYNEATIEGSAKKDHPGHDDTFCGKRPDEIHGLDVKAIFLINPYAFQR